MKSITPYLFFNGRCKEALNFYVHCLDGQIEHMQTFGETTCPGKEKPKNWDDKIMHASFKADEIVFMASDGMKEDLSLQNQDKLISLSINFPSEAEQQKVFDRFAEKGTVTMPLQDTFWGAKFGMLTDQFGIQWMFHFEKQR